MTAKQKKVSIAVIASTSFRFVNSFSNFRCNRMHFNWAQKLRQWRETKREKKWSKKRTIIAVNGQNRLSAIAFSRFPSNHSRLLKQQVEKTTNYSYSSNAHRERRRRRRRKLYRLKMGFIFYRYVYSIEANPKKKKNKIVNYNALNVQFIDEITVEWVKWIKTVMWNESNMDRGAFHPDHNKNIKY